MGSKIIPENYIQKNQIKSKKNMKYLEDNIKFKWIKTRRLQLLCYLSDFILILIIVKFLENKYLTDLNIYDLFISFIWILFGYLFGRYYNPNNDNKSILKNLKATLITYSFLLSVNLLLVSISRTLNFSEFTNTNIVILFSITLLISPCLQIFNIKLIKRGYHNKIWLYYGSNDIFNIIKDEISKTKYEKKLKIIDIGQNFDYVTESNLNHFKGICIEDINKLSDSQIEQINYFHNRGFKVFEIFDWCTYTIGNYPPIILQALDYKINLINLKKTSIDIRLKRVGDIFLSILILFLSSPILIFICLLIKLEDNGPLFYKQERNGFRKRKFTIVKLRSMKINAEESGATWASAQDNRITNIGRFLRKTRIDELPQLISVIKGEMSLIGPRPEREEFDKLLRENIPYYDYRYYIKPGLSGWAQVCYPYGASISDSEDKLSYDLFYLINYSFILDFLILIKTIRLVINRESSVPKK